jgi:hypothetical protein
LQVEVVLARDPRARPNRIASVDGFLMGMGRHPGRIAAELIGGHAIGACLGPQVLVLGKGAQVVRSRRIV